MKNKNIKLLNDFKKYCNKHPEERFWQALTNWGEFNSIHIIDKNGIQSDTFYFEEKEK